MFKSDVSLSWCFQISSCSLHHSCFGFETFRTAFRSDTQWSGFVDNSYFILLIVDAALRKNPTLRWVVLQEETVAFEIIFWRLKYALHKINTWMLWCVLAFCNYWYRYNIYHLVLCAHCFMLIIFSLNRSSATVPGIKTPVMSVDQWGLKINPLLSRLLIN